MRLRLFFILLFIVSLSVSVSYFFEFFNTTQGITYQISGRFLLLLVAAVCLQMCAHSIRAYKSHLLIDKVRKSSPKILFKGLSVGYLFNALLPFRLGEFIRAIYLGDVLSVSKAAVFMSIIFERVVDGFILSITFISAGLFLRSASTEAFRLLTGLGIVLFVVASLLLVVINIARSENALFLRAIHIFTGLFNDKLSSKLRFMAWSGIYGGKLMLNEKKSLHKYYYWSILMWCFYFTSLSMVVLIIFKDLSIVRIWFTIQSSYASVSAPAGPGYINTFANIFTKLFSRTGLEPVSSLSILLWAVMVIPISVTGLFVLLKQRFGEKQSSPKHRALINKLYRDKDISAELSHFLDAYLKGEKINQLLTQAELEDKFRLIKSFKGGSKAHTMLVWQNDELRVKKIALIQYADKLEDQAAWLIEREEFSHLPKVIAQEKTESYYYFDLAYKEDFYPFFDFIHSNSVGRSFDVLKKVLHFVTNSIYNEKPVNDRSKKLQLYIDEKVLGKITDTANMSTSVSELIGYEKLTINGISYTNLPKIIEKIRKNKAAIRDLSLYNEGPIHGDLTVDNLITSSDGDFLVIDPNNENQVSSSVVDYGKLYQSLHSGYEFLIQLESCSVNNSDVSFEDSTSHKYAEIFKQLNIKLKKDLTPPEYRSILFHEAVHYCRMLTYRATINPLTVPVFYATAVKLFNEFLEQYE